MKMKNVLWLKSISYNGNIAVTHLQMNFVSKRDQENDNIAGYASISSTKRAITLDDLVKIIKTFSAVEAK